MKSLCVSAKLLFAALVLFAFSPHPAAAFGDEWKPIDPSELALKSPVVEKDADAEVLYWEVRIADELDGGNPRTVHNNYVRIKIFTERGRESQSRVDIPFGKIYGSDVKIKDIAARTIKPDGSIAELKKSDIFERTIVKGDGIKLKAKSFAMPGVEPGAIIEYRWREVRGDTISFYDRVHLSREIPVRSAKIYVKPLSFPGFEYGMRVQTFQSQQTPFQKEKNGFYSTSLENIPAYREESYMPPEYSVRPWMLIYYSEDKKLTPEKFWKDYGKSTYNSLKSELKVNDDVKRKAAELVAGAQTDEEKIKRIFDFCRTQIKNITDDASGLTEEQARKINNKSPADTLKRGMGTGFDIDMLFAALATAAGFDARVANLADRGDIFFDPSFPDSYFIRTFNIAVRFGDEWRFFDPASMYTPYGMLRWQEEGQDALLSDPKDPVFVRTPSSPPEKSLEKRTAKLRLSEDGTLEGDVRVEYTGHLAERMKESYDEESAAQREESLKERVKSRLSSAELSGIKIENVTDPDKPFVFEYKIKAPGYAQRTGRRIILQPAFFRYGLRALFPTSDRRHHIYFPYAWSEDDSVEISLPEGFALDNAQSPSPFASGEILQYKPTLGVTKDGRTLLYTRKFFFAGSFIPSASYAQLKNIFDEIHKQDNHTILLKAATATADAKP